jgi:hypothetical protein
VDAGPIPPAPDPDAAPGPIRPRPLVEVPAEPAP